MDAGDSFADDRTLRPWQRAFVGISRTATGEVVRRRHVGAVTFMWLFIVGLPGLLMAVGGVRRLRITRRHRFLAQQFPVAASGAQT